MGNSQVLVVRPIPAGYFTASPARLDTARIGACLDGASGDNIYIRSAVKGRDAAWFRRVQQTHEGRIRAAGVEKDVTFVDADHDLEVEIDDAYSTKYGRYAGRILDSVLTPRGAFDDDQIWSRVRKVLSSEDALFPRTRLAHSAGARIDLRLMLDRSTSGDP